MKKFFKVLIWLAIIGVAGWYVFTKIINIRKITHGFFFSSNNNRSNYGDSSSEQGGRDTGRTSDDTSGGRVGGEARYYTFTFNRPWRIKYHVKREDVSRAENMLAGMGRMSLASLGLRGDEPNIQLRVWHVIYRKVYKETGYTVKRLGKIFRKIKDDHNLNDLQIAFLALRFVQFMQYRRPGGQFDFYTPPRTLFDAGKGGNRVPSNRNGNGWNGAGDCDTKVVLLMLILKELGYKSIMFHSFRYSHAMIGMAVPGADGAYKEFNGVKYYFAETTYPNWRIGQLPPQFSDIDYWVPLYLAGSSPQSYGESRGGQPQQRFREGEQRRFRWQRDDSSNDNLDTRDSDGGRDSDSLSGK